MLTKTIDPTTPGLIEPDTSTTPSYYSGLPLLAPAGQGGPIPLEEAINGNGPPSPRPLWTQALDRLQADFRAKNHHPSRMMWAALIEVLRTLDDMANGKAAPLIHLSPLDPGVGKTQSVVQFLPVLLASEKHADVGAIICANRRSQIEELIRDAKQAGLRDEQFAVYTADDKLNRLGRGSDDRNLAPVVFTTHAMVMARCKDGRSFASAEDFHFRSEPRAVRVWDEVLSPGLPITVSNPDISELIKPVSLHNAKLSAQLSSLFADLLTRKDGEQITVPDLAADCDVDLNDLEGMFDKHDADRRTTINALHFLFGREVTVRHDGQPGKSVLDFKETLPPDLKPLLVLDASARRSVKYTYSLWETGRGDIERLLEAPKDYTPLAVHHWAVSGSKSAYRDRDKRKRILHGSASAINSKPGERWLVIHHMDKGKDECFEEELCALLASPGTDVKFVHWGAHDATNAYADRPNVILAGTLFFRPSQYEALGRAAAGQPSSAGPFPNEAFEAVRRGEHRHAILQAACRGRIRKCDGGSCPPTDLYIIASKGSRIRDELPDIFPGCRVREWLPLPRRLTGNVGEAAAFIIERCRGGSFVADAEVMKHIGVSDKSYYRRRIRKHEEFLDELADNEIDTAVNGRRRGFQSVAHPFQTPE